MGHVFVCAMLATKKKGKYSLVLISSIVLRNFLYFSPKQESVDRRLGLFSRQPEEVNPLAAYEGCELEPHVPQVGPHDIWIKVRVS